MRRLKELLDTEELVRLFCLARIPHPVVIEMLALAGGYHGFWIDQEHGTISLEQVMIAALAGRANQLDSFVRMPPTGYWQVTQCLEAGVGGVMAAQIRSADHAREFVSWTKFSPLGTRGLNTGGRDADYTHKAAPQFIEAANREHFVAIQIETLGRWTRPMRLRRFRASICCLSVRPTCPWPWEFRANSTTRKSGNRSSAFRTRASGMTFPGVRLCPTLSLPSGPSSWGAGCLRTGMTQPSCAADSTPFARRSDSDVVTDSGPPRFQRSLEATSINSTASLPVIPILMPMPWACGVTATIFAAYRSSGSVSGLEGVPLAIAIACPNSAGVTVS